LEPNRRPGTALDQRTGLAARRDGGPPGVVPLPAGEFQLEELDVGALWGCGEPKSWLVSGGPSRPHYGCCA
jgi:hypothetical protein